MFFLKKIIVVLTSPLTFLFLVVLAAALWTWRRPESPWPKRVFLAVGVAFFLVTLGPFGGLLLGPIESVHPPLSDLEEASQAGHVVVLGGGYRAREQGPVTSELATSTTIRLNEGIRIHRALVDTTLVVSGASIYQEGSTAQAAAQLAIAMGVPAEEIAVEDRPRDTAEEAAAVYGLAGEGATIVLVTSASHMPRAVHLFERRGFEVIPAPTNHLTEESWLRSGTLWPSAQNVRMVERALYEYLGLLWVWIGGE